VIVITEIRINDMDIFDLLNGLRPRRIPIIVVSSESSERMIVECVRNGAFDYLSKRNIKLGYFQDILDRAVLSLAMKDENEMLENQKFNKLNKKILQSMALEKSEVTRNRLSRGIVSTEEVTLEEGNSYFMIFLFVQLGVPVSVSTSIDENRLRFLCEKYITKFTDIAAKYGHTFSLNKTNGCFFGFVGKTYFQAIVTALEIIAEMNLFNVTTENLQGKIDADIALASGNTKYNHKIGNITSDALNLCAHMALKARINHGIMITEDVYNNIGQRAMKIFKKTDTFEGFTAYLHSPHKKVEKSNV
jgi:CheY-like chemotaxis protein